VGSAEHLKRVTWRSPGHYVTTHNITWGADIDAKIVSLLQKITPKQKILITEISSVRGTD